MRKLIVLVILLFMAWSVACDELKDFVVIVRAKMYEKTKETFNKIADRFDKAREKEIGNIFRGYVKDWHGTGFIVVTDSGESYIVTNRHVVSQSSSVNIEFEKTDGSMLPYENCPVIYVDDKFDIAILLFPENACVVKTGLKIYEKNLKDGDEVWSAGFPGLLGRPGWQFAKGNITNKKARIPEIVDPAVSHLLQHSAPIDPGNSERHRMMCSDFNEVIIGEEL